MAGRSLYYTERHPFFAFSLNFYLDIPPFQDLNIAQHQNSKNNMMSQCCCPNTCTNHVAKLAVESVLALDLEMLERKKRILQRNFSDKVFHLA